MTAGEIGCGRATRCRYSRDPLSRYNPSGQIEKHLMSNNRPFINAGRLWNRLMQLAQIDATAAIGANSLLDTVLECALA